MQDLFLLFPEGESGGRNQRKEINSEQSGSLKDNIIKKKKTTHTWYATVCSDIMVSAHSAPFHSSPF